MSRACCLHVQVVRDAGRRDEQHEDDSPRRSGSHASSALRPRRSASSRAAAAGCRRPRRARTRRAGSRARCGRCARRRRRCGARTSRRRRRRRRRRPHPRSGRPSPCAQSVCAVDARQRVEDAVVGAEEHAAVRDCGRRVDVRAGRPAPEEAAARRERGQRAARRARHEHAAGGDRGRAVDAAVDRSATSAARPVARASASSRPQ